MKINLTKRQREVLDFVSSHITDTGWSPRYKDIAKFLKTDNLSSAQYHIELLEEKGWLKRSDKYNLLEVL